MKHKKAPQKGTIWAFQSNFLCERWSQGLPLPLPGQRSGMVLPTLSHEYDLWIEQKVQISDFSAQERQERTQPLLASTTSTRSSEDS
jgi:hypothetical protein